MIRRLWPIIAVLLPVILSSCEDDQIGGINPYYICIKFTDEDGNNLADLHTDCESNSCDMDSVECSLGAFIGSEPLGLGRFDKKFTGDYFFEDGCWAHYTKATETGDSIKSIRDKVRLCYAPLEKI